VDVAYLIAHWEQVRTGLIETVSKFRDEELDWKPFEASRTVREMMLHIAHEERIEFGYGISQEISEFPPEYDADAYPTVSSIQAALELVHERTRRHLATLDDDAVGRVITTPRGVSNRRLELIGHVIEHEIHHRGELSLVLGLLGREGLDA